MFHGAKPDCGLYATRNRKNKQFRLIPNTTPKIFFHITWPNKTH